METISLEDIRESGHIKVETCKSCMEENINIVDTWGGVKIRQCFGFFDQSNELNKSKHVLGSSFLFSV